MEILISGFVGLVLGAAAGGALLWWLSVNRASSRARTIVAEAESKAETIARQAELDIKEAALTQRQAVEQDLSKLRESLRDEQRTLEKRQSAVDQQAQDLRKQEKAIEALQHRLTTKLESASVREKELTEILDRQRKQLHVMTGLSREEAERRLLKLLEDELSHEVGTRIMRHEKQLQETIDQRTRDIVLTSIQRFAAAHTADSTTSSVDIPNDEMKGRIIGREGRNIRTFEKETGVDVIIDDTPGVVIVSAFDPVRREVARLSLDKLIVDGRIHPSRIEEIVRESTTEVQNLIHRKGAEAAQEVNVNGLDGRVIDLLGRLHFRTSYSQNVLRHSVEVAFLSGMIAELVGLDPSLARRCGLLHDIGKAVDHEREGGHPKIGAELLKQFRENEHVVHAALGHHDDIVIEHPYTVLVAAADACSGSRPGARRESLERYIKRMEELESIAMEFKGVHQAFAVQAGREVRVLVASAEVDDAQAARICRDIAQAFEQRLMYPGEIKVTVIRESRYMELAR